MVRMPRRTFLAGGSVALSSGRAAHAKASRPNIIFILADDLGYADTGCFGQKRIRTPNIDRLAAEGTRFTQCYCGSAVCAPSRNTLMTGQHTGHTRIRGNAPRVGGIPAVFEEPSRRLSLEAEDVTVAALLKKQGYATGLFGKWGMAEPGAPGAPEKKGFDEWIGYFNQDHAVYYYTPYLWHNGRKMLLEENRDGRRGVYSNDLFTRHALDFIEKQKQGPFFAYLAYTIPHANYEVPDLGEYAGRDWPAEAKIFAAMVSRLDGYVGQILDQLKKLGIDGNTIVFFCSDNGAPRKPWGDLFRSSLDMRGKKGTLYEGGIRTGMAVRWPGRVAAGRSSEALWYFPDFLPTALDLSGAPAFAVADGISVLPAILGKKQDLSGRWLYWEYPEKNSYSQAVRRGAWKAVRTGWGEPFALYNLAEDPGEQKDLAAAHPEIVAAAEAYARSARVESPHWPSEKSKSDPTR